MRRTLRTLVAALFVWVAAPAGGDEPALDEKVLGQMLETYVRSHVEEPVEVELPSLERFARADVEEFDVSVRKQEDAEMRGWVPIELAVSSRGKTVESGVVQVRVESQEAVVVARRTLPRGTVLRESDLVVEQRADEKVPDDAVSEVEAVIGQALTRSLAKGRPVTHGMVQTPPLVKRGQQVRLELRHGRLRIESLGRAQEEGRAGDWIRVRATESRREVTGRVAADGVVHVSL